VIRGEVYRSPEKVPERGHKPGFYVVVSRSFIAGNNDVSTVVCAPIYTEFLGLATEVAVGSEVGLPRESSIRCDFLTLMLKRRLTTLVGRLGVAGLRDLDRALKVALEVV
jgi:mRNA-degrading endonuclease toxin of MazEF toxin-antitoxin module